MPNIVNQELVRAFNIILCHNEVAITNFTVQSTDQTFFKKEDRIVISFDKNMDVGQCMEYLHNIRESIVETFCGSESGANMSFNTKFFPFNFNESQLTKDKEGYKFSVPIDKDIVLNLKCLLANGLARDVTGAMGRDFGLEYVEEYTSDESFDRKSYLYCMRFYDKRLQDYFVESFSSKVKDYKNSPKKTGDFLKIKDNRVYIKASIFDDVKFIKDIIKHKASLECRDFEVPSSEDENVENLKFSIIALLRGMGIPADTILHTSYTGSGENSVLVPIIQITSGIEGKENCRLLNKEEVSYVNRAFGMDVLRNVQDYTSPKHLPVFGNGGVYGIDFYDKDISYCVLNKIMESSVINKDHELAIDPELRLQALSPAQSPFNSPTHAEPPRTPPNQRKADTDSGYDSNSPPKPKDSGSSSGGPGPSTELSDMEWESPTRNQNVALKDSPRRESEKFSVVLPKNPLDIPGTSGGPLTRLGYSTVSKHIEPEKCVNAAQNVPASTNLWAQQPDPWSLQSTSGNKWQWPPEPGPSGLSWKGANESGSASTSAPSPWSFSGPYVTQKPTFLCYKDSDDSRLPGLLTDARPIFRYSIESGSSSFKSTPAAQPQCRWSFSPPPPFIPSSGGIVPRLRPPTQVSSSEPSSSKGAQAGASISEKEKELIEALLYTLNLMNYTLDGVYTNFFAKDGKIVSLLHDTVDRGEYLQKVRDYIIEEYCEDEEEASKVCDLDEFPFKLNYEEKQEKTVVANISSGALSNLKILFSRKSGKNVDAIDIDWVKEVEKHEKNEWVDRQLSEGCNLKDACISCLPDKSVIKVISIVFNEQEGEYVLDRNSDISEVRLLYKEQSQRKGTSVAGKGESDDKPLTEEEKESFEELLYWFNSNNYALDPPHTNFIVKNGKIASLIHGSVDVKEYLQEIIDKTKKEYCFNNKKTYDPNEFPFKFLSNCEKNQETTIVANISRGALLNLKKLFSSMHGGKVKIKDIDINIVKKAVESQKNEWVNSQVREHRYPPQGAIESCYPDEDKLEDIPITKGKDGYWIYRDYNPSEIKSFREERWPAKGRSKAGKVKPEGQDSGISSGEATDAENVSSKAKATTSSGYESMDCENTGGESPKRSLELSMGMEELAISTTLNAPQSSPAKKLRSNEV